jgi:hypothetical protein
MNNLSPPQLLETELLNKAGFGPDIRLACQALLIGPGVTIQRLVAADEEEEAARDAPEWKNHDVPAAAGAG